MKEVYIENIFTIVHQRLKELERKNVFDKNKNIILFGLGRTSNMTRTILSSMGYCVYAYVDNNEILVRDEVRYQKNFASKYLNNTDNVIKIKTPQELLSKFDDTFIILISSKYYNDISKQLESYGYQENLNYFKVYDIYGETDFTKYVQNKKSLTLDEIHNVGIGLLKHLHEFCQEHNLRYWLSGGSMLGALRHKGFIPWDDDIDVFLPMSDYLKLTQIYQDSDEYMLVTPYKYAVSDYNVMLSRLFDRRTVLREYEFPIRRIGSVCVDIWPLIGMPSEKKERDQFISGYYELRKRMWEAFYTNNGSLEKFADFYAEQWDYLYKYDFDSSEYVGVMPTQYFEKDCTRRSVYDETIQVPFENIIANIPSGYQEYLDNLYGKDWNKLPEEAKRKTHHIYDVYWR